MTSNAPLSRLPVSNLRSTGNARRQMPREQNQDKHSIQDSLKRITAAFGKPDQKNLDTLLRAAASQSANSASETSLRLGDISVAIDSISCWIGKAEQRFKLLSESSNYHTQLLSQVLSVIETELTQAREKTEQCEHIASHAASSVASMKIDMQDMRTVYEDRLARTGNRLELLSMAVSALDKKLARLEERNVAGRNNDLEQKINDIGHQLDRHANLAASNANSSAAYFDVMNQRIEALGEELGELRQNRDILACLPEITERLEKLSASERHLSILEARLNEIIQTNAGASFDTTDLVERLDQLSADLERLNADRGASTKAREDFRVILDSLRDRVLRLEQTQRGVSTPPAPIPTPAPVTAPVFTPATASVPVPAPAPAPAPVAPAVIEEEQQLASSGFPSVSEQLEAAIHQMHNIAKHPARPPVQGPRIMDHNGTEMPEPEGGIRTNAHIRSDFITAARHAMRTEKNAPMEASIVLNGTPVSPSRFLR